MFTFFALLAAPTVHLCADEPQAIEELAGLVRLGRVVPGCVGAHVVRFVAVAGGVQLHLTAPGAALHREVPWLQGVDQPLARTALADRQRALAVLLDGLLLEHQLAAPEPVAPPSQSPPSEPPPRRKPLIPRAKVEAPPSAHPVPASTETPFDPGPAPLPEPPPILTLAPATEASAAEKVCEPGGLPRGSAAEAGSLDDSLCFATARSDALPPPAPGRVPFWGGVHLGGRWRTPDLLIPQAWIQLGYRAARVALGWQPGIRWAWSGRAFSTQSLSLALGAHLPLLSGDGWHLRAPLSALGEATRVERTDVDGAPFTLGQLGLETGVSFAIKLNDFIWLTTEGIGRWLPLGTLEVEGGPTVPFNQGGFELGLGLLVAPAW